MNYIKLKDGSKEPQKRNEYYESCDELSSAGIALDNYPGVCFVDFDNLESKNGIEEIDFIKDDCTCLTGGINDVFLEIFFMNHIIGPIYSYILSIIDQVDDKDASFVESYKAALSSLLMIEGAFRTIKTTFKLNLIAHLSRKSIKKIKKILEM